MLNSSKFILSLFYTKFKHYLSLAQVADSHIYQSLTWSSDSKKLAYAILVKDSAKYRSDLYVVNADGTGNRKIATSAEWASWSPNGKLQAYGAEANHKHVIVVAIADGSNPVVITDTSLYARFPSFSPDSKQICFSVKTNGSYNIYSCAVSGKNLQQLTAQQGDMNVNPMWNPVNDQIVYYKERKGSKDKIYTVSTNDKKETLLTDDTLHNTYPSWNAHGTAALYGSEIGERKVICTIDLLTKRLTLIPSPPKTFLARMSPDGKKIAFLSGGFPSDKIFICDSNGENCAELLIKATP